MSTSRALEELTRAASAAGYAMATVEDETALLSPLPVGEEVARGERIPTATQVLSSLPAPVARTTRTEAKGFVAGAQQVREAVFGYFGLGGATA